MFPRRRISSRIVTATMPGRVMLRSRCQRFAPSTAAASYRSAGMPCRPASRLIMKNG